MRLSFGLEQRLVQKQIMAPRMIQSMEILQLPVQALEERIEQELGDNPILERLEEDPALPDEGQEREDSDRPSVEERELVVGEGTDGADDFERLLSMDQDVPDYFDERPRQSSNRLQEDSDRQHDAIANVATRPVTLQDALENQLRELDLDRDTFAMAERIISSLDANGYLAISLRDLLPVTAEAKMAQVAERALKIVQSLEPAGVGARDLRECLLLQLTPGMPFYDELELLVRSHLMDLKENRLPAIQKKTGMSIERIQEAWQELRKLNPKPGAIYADVHVPLVVPDVFVDRDESGKYTVWLEEERMPRLRISNYYRQRLMTGEATAEEKEYIKRKLNAAQWLIESIEQRRGTLTRVSQAIVDHQVRFLDEGPEAIEPLKMQQVADKVGVHVTTVSRAVDEKWIQTPRGIYPLRNFFVGGTVSADGEEVAWDTIRVKLQELIDREDKANPLSDDDLVDELAKHGLTVARRTITKYRKKMGVPSSRQRRDWSQ